MCEWMKKGTSFIARNPGAHNGQLMQRRAEE
jgi:hypothetical protein